MSGPSAKSRVLVTGAAGSIGRACARLLTEQGWSVIATDLTEPDLSGSLVIAGDLRRPEFRAELASTTGPLDAVLLAHGEVRTEPVDALDPEAVARVLDVNVSSALFTALALRPSLGRGASIVFVGSVAGLRAVPLNLIYGASKAALHSVAASLAVSFAPDGIRVNTVCPGIIMSPQTERANADLAAITGDTLADVISRRSGAIPMQRCGKPEEVAEAIVGLLLPGMSYVTGARLLVAGGLLAGEA